MSYPWLVHSTNENKECRLKKEKVRKQWVLSYLRRFYSPVFSSMARNDKKQGYYKKYFAYLIALSARFPILCLTKVGTQVWGWDCFQKKKCFIKLLLTSIVCFCQTLSIFTMLNHTQICKKHYSAWGYGSIQEWGSNRPCTVLRGVGLFKNGALIEHIR